jgi:hypothetical protein
MGNHRYQIGFSGDASITWKSLAFQPYFTATASNVLYGYWSHDIGGHIGTKDSTEAKGQHINPELYTRWLQYGVFSPILRTHSVRGLPMNREPWEFATKYGEIISDYIQLRYSLAPYIYTMARKTYDSGISLCRPLYYDYPTDNESYNQKSEYMFGDDLLVAQIAEPLINDVSTKNIWLPKGNWIELSTGKQFVGNQTLARQFTLNEYPIYAKQGAIIPTYPTLKHLKQNCDTVILKVYGKGNAESHLYEDAGDDDKYKNGQSSITRFKSEIKGYNKQVVSILPTVGNFVGMSPIKTYLVQLHGQSLPLKVTVNGVDVPFSTTISTQKSWKYLSDVLAVEIAIPKMDKKSTIVIEVTYPDTKIDLNGLLGKMKTAENVFEYLKANTKLALVPTEVCKAGALKLNLNYEPTSFYKLVGEFLATYTQLEKIIGEMALDKKHPMKIRELMK